MGGGGLLQDAPGFVLLGEPVDSGANRAHLLDNLSYGQAQACCGQSVSKHGEISQCRHAHEGMDAHLGIGPVILGHEGDVERALGAAELILDDVPVHVGLVDLPGAPALVVCHQDDLGQAPDVGLDLVAVKLEGHGRTAPIGEKAQLIELRVEVQRLTQTLVVSPDVFGLAPVGVPLPVIFPEIIELDAQPLDLLPEVMELLAEAPGVEGDEHPALLTPKWRMGVQIEDLILGGTLPRRSLSLALQGGAWKCFRGILASSGARWGE